MTASKAPSEWIEQHRDSVLEFTKKYIEHRSPTEQEETVQREFIEPFFRSQMAWDEVEIVDTTEQGNRPNVNARFASSGDGQTLLFNGHSDVVDVSQEQADHWTHDPWNPVVEDGRLYGRGANDMKGPNAAMIWAVKALMETDVDPGGDVLMSIVVGEEFGHENRGTIAATEAFQEQGHHIPFCVNTEPTNNEIHVTSAYSVNFEITLSGKAVHGSQHNLTRYPQRYGLAQGDEVGVDVVPMLRELLGRLESLEQEWNMRYDHEVWGSGGQPQTLDEQGTGTITLIPTLIDVGHYVASVPRNARIEGQMYLPPNVDPDELWAEFEATVAGLAKTYDWLKKHPPSVEAGDLLDHLDGYRFWPAFEVSTEHLGAETLGGAVEEVTDENPVFSGFKAVSDAGFIQDACGVDVVSFGPGDTSMGTHGEDEFVPIDQLITATKVYAEMIQRWCGE